MDDFIEFRDFYASVSDGNKYSNGKIAIDLMSSDNKSVNVFRFTIDFEDDTGLNLLQYACISKQTNAIKEAISVSKKFVPAYEGADKDFLGRTKDWYKVQYNVGDDFVDIAAESEEGRTVLQHVIERFEEALVAENSLLEIDYNNRSRMCSPGVFMERVFGFESARDVLNQITPEKLMQSLDAKIWMNGIRAEPLTHIFNFQRPAWRYFNLDGFVEKLGARDDFLTLRTKYNQSVVHFLAEKGLSPRGFQHWLLRDDRGDTVAKKFIDGIGISHDKPFPYLYPLDHVIDDSGLTARQYLDVIGLGSRTSRVEDKFTADLRATVRSVLRN